MKLGSATFPVTLAAAAVAAVATLWAAPPEPVGQPLRGSPRPHPEAARPAPSPTAIRRIPTPTPTPVPGEIRVSVSVTGPGQKAAPAADAVVWIPGSKEGAPPPRGKVTSKNKRFDPRVTAVSAGATVDFPNLDRIHHNVFSLSEKAKFDLGLYKNGASKPHTFENPGLVRIYCNIHPQMAGFVMVVDGRLHALTDASGTAVLSSVPPGKHPLRVWDEKGGEWSGEVEVRPGAATPVTVTFDARSWRDQPHKRKDGTDYPPPDDDENRY